MIVITRKAVIVGQTKFVRKIKGCLSYKKWSVGYHYLGSTLMINRTFCFIKEKLFSEKCYEQEVTVVLKLDI